MNTFDEIKKNPVSRRAFLGRMSAAGLGMAAIALLDGCGGGSNNNSGSGGSQTGTALGFTLPGRNVNEQVLNFALTLEILEADLYRQALNIAAGKDPGADLASSSSSYNLAIGAGSVNAGAGFAYLRDFAYVEAAHRDFLMMVLDSLKAPKVKRASKGYTFGPLAPTGTVTLEKLLTSIYPLEEEGVSAYLGAAPFLTDLSIVQTAVTIYSTEARHSAAIAYILGKDTGPAQSPAAGVGARQKVKLQGNTLPYGSGNVFEYFIAPTEVRANIDPLIVS